jgi:tetratricopeptide (TPR) repeat protein
MNPPPEVDLAKSFDVFLCYNSKDKEAIRAIAHQLKDQGISYWLDEDQLPPGCFWLDTQERDMAQLKTVAVFIGQNGIGKWQRLEISIFLQEFVAHQIPVIPVFLADAPQETDLLKFLKLFTWVDFRLTDPDPMAQLIRGITLPPPIASPGFIAETKKIIETETQENIPNNLTQQGAIAFVGRDAELDRLHDLLQQETPVAIGAIAGMGGVGKTELALQFAYRERDRQTYPGSICWLQARQDLKIQLVLFAQTRLGLHPPTDLDLDAQLQWCWQHWGKGKTLLVLDDVQDYADVENLRIPGRSQFKVLMTTRSHFGSSVRELNLEVLSEEAALKLLRSLVKDGRIDRQLVEAKAICEWLGYLPLGLELVGRYLARKPDVLLTKLQERLQDKRLEAKALKDREPGMTASLGMAAAFELSWQELPPEAQQLAAWLSLFALAEIPWHWVQACLPEQDEEELEDLRDTKLVGLSLLKRTEMGHYQLHQLLREFFATKRQQMTGAETWHETFLRVICAEAQRSSERPTRSLLDETTAVIPHLQAAIEYAESTQQELTVAIGKDRFARLYYLQGRYGEAEPLYLQALEITRSKLGHDHPATAASLNSLAQLYRSQGRYGEAEPLFLQALKIMRSQLGHDHPSTATCLDSLAKLYDSQGRYSEAEPLYLQALEITRSQLGHDHRDMAISLNNLAELYRSQGHYGEAEPLFLQALGIMRSQLGHDHPDMAISLNNLALLYNSQGRYSEAEPLFLQALEIRRSQLGHDHPSTAISLNSLAGLYNSQGRYSEAELFYFQALEIRRSQLGHDHPSTAISLNNLASLYQWQGRYSEAELLYVQALAILFSRLGKNHPLAVDGLSNFYTCLQQALEAGQGDRLSDHPLTQAILQQLRTP